MKIQIVSDLHLEFRDKKNNDILIPSAPILCMVGDICACGIPEDFEKFLCFLDYFSQKFEYILHVAGNHEYYVEATKKKHDTIASNTMVRIDRRLKFLNKKYPNYFYLNNSTWEYTDKKKNETYVFAGTTLWTYVPANLEILKKNKINLYKEIESNMNDYRCIYVSCPGGYRQFSMEDMQKKHKLAMAFLKYVINDGNKDKKKKYILLTHHKPLFDKNTDRTDIYTYAYASDLDKKLLVPPFKVAAHGHTHVHYDRMVNGIRVVSNPKGYIGQRTDYNAKFTVNV